MSKLREEFPDSTWAEGIMDDYNVTFTMVDAPGAPQRYKFYVQRVPHGHYYIIRMGEIDDHNSIFYSHRPF